MSPTPTTFPNLISGRLKSASEVCDISATQKHPIGMRHAPDERTFYYAHCRSAALLGKGRPALTWNTGGTQKGAYLGIQTLGSYTVGWTVQTDDVTKDQFAGGYVMLQGGYTKRIVGNTAAAAAAVTTLTLLEPITEAAAAGRYGILVEALYSNVYDRSQTGDYPGLVVGVAVVQITADHYGWLQTWGPCSCMLSQTDKGDANAEAAWVSGANPGSECIIEAADGYQVIGHNVPMNTINFDNENFAMLDLCIRP